MIPTKKQIKTALKRDGHLIILTIAAFWLLFSRLRHIERYVNEGQELFAGVVPYYMYRSVDFTVQNWPHTINYDMFLRYPEGSSVDTFGTLYEQLLATIALVVGLGDPSETTIYFVTLITPVIIVGLLVLPLYALIFELTESKKEATFGVIILALLPGHFFVQTTVGTASSASLELFLLTATIFSFVVVIKSVREEVPTLHLLFENNIKEAQKTIKWGIITAVVYSLYVFVFPLGILFNVIFTMFIFIFCLTQYYLNNPIEPVLFGLSIFTGTTTLLLSIGLVNTSLTFFSVSILHFTISLSVFLFTIALIPITRYNDTRNSSYKIYSALVLTLFSTPVIGLLYVYPDFIDELFIYLTQGSDVFTDDTQYLLVLTQDIISINDIILMQYGLLFYLCLFGIVYMLIIDDILDPINLFVTLWFIVTVLFCLFFVQYLYYASIPVIVVSSYTIGIILDFNNFSKSPERLSDINARKILALLVIVVVLVPTLLVPVPVGTVDGISIGSETTDNTFTQQDILTPEPGIDYADTMEWMESNTPETGNYAGVSSGTNYYGIHSEGDTITSNDYSVFAPGRNAPIIVGDGERIAHNTVLDINANFLLSDQDEETASQFLQREGDRGLGPQYVMVDSQSTHPDTGLETLEAAHPQIQPGTLANSVFTSVQSPPMYLYEQQYYESMQIRLYHYHGSLAEPQPIVAQWEEGTMQGVTVNRPIPGENFIQEFDSMEEAEEFVANTDEDVNAQIGGIGVIPQERVEALENYRLVYASESSMFTNDRILFEYRQLLEESEIPPQAIQPSSESTVKTFERVPGAVIEGEGPENETLRLSTTLVIENTGETFPYQQIVETNEEGEFEATVPYATTGYEQWGTEEGFTETGVFALQSYNIINEENGEIIESFNVREGQVIGAEQRVVSVEFDNEPIEENNNGESESN